MASNSYRQLRLLVALPVLSTAVSADLAFNGMHPYSRAYRIGSTSFSCKSHISTRAKTWPGCSMMSVFCTTAAMSSGAALALRSHMQRSGRRASRAEWHSHCRDSDGRAVFDLRITKPLGAELREFPDRPGVGIAQIMEGGGIDALNDHVLTGEGSGMWALEGDEVVGVNGSSCEGAALDAIVALIAGSEGSEITLTLARNYLKNPKGPVKVLFLPSSKMVTVGRRKPLTEVAEFADESVNYSCKEGWCGTCWHREQCTGEVFKPCCGEIPASWDNVMPFTLIAEPKTNAAK
eukprot:TRINITY_DN33986_c0_g1_i1.p1 TRINITY_DN33986_c0_g1~~TRINITY_DN33986_c0_g1_i1.p1  ORF type:complete len:299 (+),score=26.72 TRINITY_DN33986_c0_g1_i1:23-898(+)